MKVGTRKVLIDAEKATAWLREKFEVNRRPSDYRPRGGISQTSGGAQ